MESSKFKVSAPIIIPSLKRYKKAKNPIMMIDSCLANLHKYYEPETVHIIAQEYTEEDKEYLIEEYPNVKWEWYDKRLGIINTFNRVKDVGCQYPYYIHHDDDVAHTHQFSANPTLTAMEHAININLDRIGIVTTASISIHHFKKMVPDYISLHCNPAQLVIINSKAAKDCKYDDRFSNFRSDTDFTMQIASKGYIPILLNRYFSFMHTVPLSKITYTEEGGRKFETLDNITDTRGSIGGIRDMENRKREYDQFQEKWPKVSTHKNYKQQLLKKSVVSLTKFRPVELVEIQKSFDFNLVNDWQEGYYKGNTPEKFAKNLALFG